jgi:hypothetical protein
MIRPTATWYLRLVPAATAFIGAIVLGPATLPALADDVIQSHTANIDGITAEIIQCTRAGDRLTIALRLHNTSSYALRISNAGFNDFYLMAGDKKYLVLGHTGYAATPDNKVSVDNQTSANFTLFGGQSLIWHAQYAAPPTDIKNITFHMGGIARPFENVRITD